MNIPYHVAIIMDGNGRWAKERRLPRYEGHRQGMERVREIIRAAKKIGIKTVTIFAFSTENWNRPKKEIDFLFSHIGNFLKKYTKELMQEGMRLNVIGRRDRIKEGLAKRIEETEKITRDNKEFIFNVAFDYGGRWDIIRAAKKIAGEIKEKKLFSEQLEESIFAEYLSLGGQRDPDLLIRTSGEYRISNFLLWNLAYAELYFTKTLWPDFKAAELKAAVEAYAQRERRFGGL